MATREIPVCDPRTAWPLESRRQLMRDVVSLIAAKGGLHLKNAAAIAATYDPEGRILPCEVEAEMMKHLSEGDGK